MAKDLTTSTIDRQNILNNPEAVIIFKHIWELPDLLFKDAYSE